jgi:hypothetical protein
MPDDGRFFREETSFKFLWIKRNAAAERKLSTAAGRLDLLRKVEMGRVESWRSG